MRCRLIVAGIVLMGAFPAAAIAEGPSAIGVDDGGVTYVGFPAGGEIARYGVGGAELTSWGTPGTAPGELGGVVAIAVAPLTSGGHAHAGDVWLLDTNRRVQEFTRTGHFIQGVQLGPCAAGITPDPLARGGLDVTYSAVYVAHPCADEVLKLDRSNLHTLGAVQLPAPKGVAAQLYDTAPANTRSVYVAQPSLGRISELEPADLSLVGSRSVAGAPTDVFVDAYGVLFVSDGAAGAVDLYDASGSEFRTLGQPPGGTEPGSLEAPNALDVFDQNDGDLNGNIFVADTGNERVQRWNSYGYAFWVAPASGGTGPATPPPLCADGAHGVSILAGATFTGSADVRLAIHEPPRATDVAISNDGGFANPTVTPVRCDDGYPWTLARSGPERLPKTVYVRFEGPGINSDQTFTDDIILDETQPTVKRASLEVPSGTLRVKAHDNVAGVAKLQVAPRPGARKVKTLPYKRRQRIPQRRAASYVRAVDRAGNVGEWHRVKRLFAG